jgi:hypothetical protein
MAYQTLKPNCFAKPNPIALVTCAEGALQRYLFEMGNEVVPNRRTI